MSEVVIKVRENGPYRITGPITLIDADGTPYELPGENVALCRCGGSKTKPFCDATHREIGFCATERVGSAVSATEGT